MIDLSRHKEELEALHLAHCAQTEKLSQIQVCPLASSISLPNFVTHFMQHQLSYVVSLRILHGVESSVFLKYLTCLDGP